MAERLEDFFGHEEEAIATAAKLLVEAKESYQAGDLSKAEFEEIAKDVLEVHEIEKLASSVERKAAIKSYVEILAKIISTIV